MTRARDAAFSGRFQSAGAAVRGLPWIFCGVCPQNRRFFCRIKQKQNVQIGQSANLHILQSYIVLQVVEIVNTKI